jgi:hypothetical protein
MASYKGLRSSLKPSRVEVNLRAIPVLSAPGWKLYSTAEWQLIGAAPKGYLAFGDPERPETVGFIAKKGRIFGVRECVTEEIISQIGRMLPLRVARSLLVRLPPSQGQRKASPGTLPDVRFMSRNFLRRGEQAMLHGLEVVAEYLDSDQEEVTRVFNLTDKGEERRFYTIDFIVVVLRWWGRNERERQSLVDGLGRMLAFDALVGAPDRHALNWAVLEDLHDADAPRRFAPIFDTARGLFGDHDDARLRSLVEQGRQEAYIETYANRSKPVFGCQEQDAGDKVNHFQLIEYAVTQLGDDLAAPIRQIINSFHHADVHQMLLRRFRRVISPLRLDFISNLLRFRSDRLKIVVQNRGRR